MVKNKTKKILRKKQKKTMKMYGGAGWREQGFAVQIRDLLKYTINYIDDPTPLPAAGGGLPPQPPPDNIKIFDLWSLDSTQLLYFDTFISAKEIIESYGNNPFSIINQIVHNNDPNGKNRFNPALGGMGEESLLAKVIMLNILQQMERRFVGIPDIIVGSFGISNDEEFQEKRKQIMEDIINEIEGTQKLKEEIKKCLDKVENQRLDIISKTERIKELVGKEMEIKLKVDELNEKNISSEQSNKQLKETNKLLKQEYELTNKNLKDHNKTLTKTIEHLQKELVKNGNNEHVTAFAGKTPIEMVESKSKVHIDEPFQLPPPPQTQQNTNSNNSDTKTCEKCGYNLNDANAKECLICEEKLLSDEKIEYVPGQSEVTLSDEKIEYVPGQSEVTLSDEKTESTNEKINSYPKKSKENINSTSNDEFIERMNRDLIEVNFEDEDIISDFATDKNLFIQNTKFIVIQVQIILTYFKAVSQKSIQKDKIGLSSFSDKIHEDVQTLSKTDFRPSLFEKKFSGLYLFMLLLSSEIIEDTKVDININIDEKCTILYEKLSINVSKNVYTKDIDFLKEFLENIRKYTKHPTKKQVTECNKIIERINVINGIMKRALKSSSKTHIDIDIETESDSIFHSMQENILTIAFLIVTKKDISKNFKELDTLIINITTNAKAFFVAPQPPVPKSLARLIIFCRNVHMTFVIGKPSDKKEAKSEEQKAKETKDAVTNALQAIGTKRGGKRNLRKTRRNRKRQ